MRWNDWSRCRNHWSRSSGIPTSEAILIIDAFGVVVEVNDAFTTISGYDREDVIGQRPDVFRSSRQGPELIDAMLNGLTRDGYYEVELWSRRKDGVAYVGFLKVNAVKNTLGEVQNYIALFADITSLRAKQEQMEHLAHYDALTDLPNRILLSDRLHQAMATCRVQERTLAVLYLDLDGFKEVNDAHGHSVGDELLVSIASRMRSAIRDVDTLARIGGDEFVIVLADMDNIQKYIALIEKILAVCSEPVKINGDALRVSASIGVTVFPRDDADVDQLLRNADHAMYEAKQAGKNRYHLYDLAMHAEVKNLGLQHHIIESALKANEFVLYYQPKVNMRTGGFIGVEALIRWNHPTQGLLSPDRFLPSIENHSLSEALDEWVLNSALKQMDLWQREGLFLSVSVNIGARQLQKPDLALRLASLLARYPNIDPSTLGLEILETSALKDIQAVSCVMRECLALGIHFSIDDFGTGYSSLTYLRHLPADTLKIDQSFIRNMLEDSDNLAIIQGVIGLAAAFEKKVIAEGVESAAIGEKLLSLGCELGQGYVIARPMPADLLPQWISTWHPDESWTA